MNLENGGDGSMEIIGLWLRCIMDIDRELTARNCE
jgi:hypothetical protein